MLDENITQRLAKLLPEHEVLTVSGLGWIGTKNGELLRRACNVCDVFITRDRNLEFQQNIKALPFGVIVLHAHSSDLSDLAPHVPSILTAIQRVTPGHVERVGEQKILFKEMNRERER